MKLFRVFLLTASVVLLLVSCRDGAVLNGPVGNYLYIAIDVPETEDGQSFSRVIHPESATIDVSLTYQNGRVIEGSGDLSSSSDVTHTLEQLPVGTDVLVEVTLGVDGLDLCSSSVIMDINPGGNSTDIVLAYSEYTVQGTLVDTNGVAIPSQAVEVDGTTVTTDTSGKFSFTVTTEDWDGYTKFYMNYPVEGELEFARNKKNLIENRSAFTLTARPEFFVDMTILSDSFPLKGATVGVDIGDGYNYAGVTSDANGRLLYGPVDWNYNNESLQAIVEYKGVFVEHTFMTKGAPGAIVGEVTLDPYVIFSAYVDGNYRIYKYDFENDLTYSTSTIASLASLYDTGYSSGPTGITQGVKLYCNYETGELFMYARYNRSGEMTTLWRFNDWNSSPTVVELTSPFDPAFSMGFSVQQMTAIDNNTKILAATTYGAFTFDAATLATHNVWEFDTNVSYYALVLNGAYQASDGTLYVIGFEMAYDISLKSNQSIWRLNSDGSYTEVFYLDNLYSTAEFGTTYLYDTSYNSLIGLFAWDDDIVSAKTQDTSDTGGVIVQMNDWNIKGFPIDNNFDYLVPVGILPNNKFYIVNDIRTNGDKKIISVDKSGSTSVKTFVSDTLSDPSAMRTMLYYFDPSGLSSGYAF